MADREGFWISPAGKSIPIHEHVAYMRQYPKKFGFTPKQAETWEPGVWSTREELLLAAIARGWIRVRGYGTYTSFDVAVFDDDAIWRIKRHLKKTHTWPNETVTVNEHRHKKMYEEAADWFFTDEATKYARNPRRGRRK